MIKHHCCCLRSETTMASTTISSNSNPIQLLILLVIFFTALTIITTTSILSSHGSFFYPFPNSMRSKITDLQAQTGSLLKELRTVTGDYKTHHFKVMDSLLHIAIVLDGIADTLSQHSSSFSEATCRNGDGGKEDDEDGELQSSPFKSGEAQSYTSPKPNKYGSRNFLGIEAIRPSVGLACASMPTSFDRYMDYKLYEMCPDDWNVAQKLMLAGCDPLPRRKCFSRSSSATSPSVVGNHSLWKLPDDDHRILWTHYKCKGFSCLTSSNPDGKGFFKCSSCFNLTTANIGWNNNTVDPTSAEFSIDRVLSFKPSGDIQVGLDFSPSTGTFAAIMKEKNVTIATATVNLGAPFSEVIALRGLIPIYLSIGTRLPFFDNTLDIIHSSLFLDGWIQPDFLQYVVIDWDRVLRPGGLMWVDRFFCRDTDMVTYLTEFQRLGYKKLLWTVVPKIDKNGDELFFSAVLEKPVR